MKQGIGICLGAWAISVVNVIKNNEIIEIENVERLIHNGNPKDILLKYFKNTELTNKNITVTGRKFRNNIDLNSIPEVEAIEYALSYVNQNKHKYSAILSLGAETFILYNLDNYNKIASVVSKNKCASGTGEFFLQQIKRMDLSIDEAIDISKNTEPYKVSGRCSVFCKSDCTHALNKGVPKANVASGLAKMIAEKIEELLRDEYPHDIMLIGGVTKNKVVMDFLRQKYSKIAIPDEADHFEALGAAVYAINNDIQHTCNYEKIFINTHSSFSFQPPLDRFINKVTFNQSKRRQAKPNENSILGLDVGSTTTKAVAISTEDNMILASEYLYTNGDPIAAAKKCYKALHEQLPTDINITGLGTTGSGRQIAGMHALTDGIFNEITAHSTAAVFFDGEVDTIFEIGGQDAKYTYIVNKVPADYAMNEACSAGTGSFIEEAAFESLGISLHDIEPLALKGDNPPNFSDQCAAFISSDIKTAQQEGISHENIIAGLTYSICMNYINRVKGNRPAGKKIFMQGGVCYNKAIPVAMAALADREIIVPPDPGLMGAFGVALEVKAKQRIGLLKKDNYSLQALANRAVKYHPDFICNGGKEGCDLSCKISMIEIEGRKYPFGGACDKYNNYKQVTAFDIDRYDFIAKRNLLMFNKYSRCQ